MLRLVVLKGVQAPHKSVGNLEVCWTPVECLDEGGTPVEVWPPAIDAPDEMLGKPWTYRYALTSRLLVTCAS
jgi:hypothetical protein